MSAQTICSRLTALCLLFSGGWNSASGGGEPISFNRQIRPILSDKCYACHGFDANARQADLRLDQREAAVQIIAPGSVEQSELLRRIFSSEPGEQMPPADAPKALTAAEKLTLKLWVAQGAPYDPHWSFVPLQPIAVPTPQTNRSWPRNPIDRFVLHHLEQRGLAPSPEATKETLIRRVTLDLTGLPPSQREVTDFLADNSGEAFEKVVDRLLSSPHFGERMSLDWLDAARYADTNGYQVDRDREMWAWRDWVIAAFNANMSFDQFTVEQLAGDLLPNATLTQRIATGFNRNHMLNEEGGIIPEEFLAEYAADRVETTAAVWLGQTFTCCRCHDHKYDPFTARDFYRLKAFFNNIPEKGIGDRRAPPNASAPPFIQLPSPDLDQKRLELEQQRAELAALLPTAKLDSADSQEKRSQIEALEQQIAAIVAGYSTTMVMQEMKSARETYVLIRGAYDKPGERVTAGTPAVLPPMADDLPRNRLGLAQWLIAPQNPLTSRVVVNRFWQQLFGAGLVKTSEDFGAQGDPPSHPLLLDWLAAEFMQGGWDVKKLMRLIATSATYRQQSHVTPKLAKQDPDNRLLARGPRSRLAGEFIRDQALAVGGLLVSRLGGPAVRPYHPPGLYETMAATSADIVKTYVPDRGEGLFRRSLYTYWKRSIPHPAMLAFGTPFRETCVLRRPQSNTPLQALVLMNDPTYVEAARGLAEHMLVDGGSTTRSRLEYGFRRVLARSPTASELSILQTAYQRTLSRFQRQPTDADDLLAVGTVAPRSGCSPLELATFTTIASTLLCLDETLTKQ